MALPLKQAAELAKSMAKKGLSGGISMSEPKDDDEEMPGDDMQEVPDMDDGGDEAVIKDIDAVGGPGLGKLIQELIDRCMSKDSEPDDGEEKPSLS